MKRLIALVLAAIPFASHGESLNDPMRPPVYQAPVASGAPSGPVLQTIVIAKDRRYALISGERVPVGGAYGDAKVVRIAENEVTLRDATGGDTVLKLVPEIKKQIVAPKLVDNDAIKGGK